MFGAAAEKIPRACSTCVKPEIPFTRTSLFNFCLWHLAAVQVASASFRCRGAKLPCPRLLGHGPGVAGREPGMNVGMGAEAGRLCWSGPYKLGFDIAPLEGDCRHQLDSAVTLVLRF
jgi:hypothetical protein